VGFASGAPYAVKAHGSELEYSMRGRPELEAWGREVLEAATATFVGSAHIREVVDEVCGHVDRVHEVPPGVDIEEWRPQPRDDALAALVEEALRDPPNAGNANERLPDEGNAHRLSAFLAGDAPTVVYFGKLLRNKGVHVLLEALDGIDARAVVVGFGDYRAELETMATADRVLFTGPLEHRHLVHLLALADTCVVPSIFPEAFGMVAAEAAAAGCPPLVARHSGLAEVAEGLEAEYSPALRHLTSFRTGDAADLRAKLVELLALPPDRRVEIREAARHTAVRRWSWESVAERLVELGREPRLGSPSDE
jgi:glycosyltransferase involved in cell wall biosynthesis